MRLVVWGGEFTNKGAEAMLLTTVTELSSRIPGLEVLIWTYREEENRIAAENDLVAIDVPRFNGKLRKLAWILGQAAKHGSVPRSRVLDPSSWWLEAASAWMLGTSPTFDGLVDMSGFAYGDVWGTFSVRRILPFVTTCREKSLPVVFLPQAWGSFTRPDVRADVAGIIKGTNTVLYSRDAQSSEYLAEILGSDYGPIQPRADIVFAFKGGTEQLGHAKLRAMGCSLERRLVGIAPNMRVFERSHGKRGSSAYVDALAGLVRHCVDSRDLDVVLLPNECSPVNSGTDDRRLCELVASAASREGRCHFSGDYVSAEDMHAVVGCLDYLVGSRFHALVFGLSQGIPCMAIGWSHKYVELLHQFGLADYVCSGNGLIEDDIIQMFQRGWAERLAHSTRISDIAAAMRSDVASLFDNVAGFMTSRSTPS